MSRQDIAEEYGIPIDILDKVFDWILKNNDTLDLWGTNE